MAAFYNVDVYSDRIPLHTVRKEPPLNLAEKQYILAVERGDLAGVRHYLEEAEIYFNININCRDPLGRSALLIAIQNENIEIIELLLRHNVHVGSALLHAIDEEVVEAVELLLNYKPPKKDPRAQLLEEPWENDFDPDISPVILAAHRNNYEILKILIERGVSIPKPHDAKCGCEECRSSMRYDGLRHSRSRLNIYRALASPSLISLCSEDPILTAFELSWELRKLSHRENEFKDEYEELAEQCREFATQLLDETRGSNELGTILNRDHTHPTGSLPLSRLRLAIKYKQKTFTAHPNCQQLLAEQWYEGLPGWRRQHWTLKVLICFFVGMSFPLLSVMYLLAPKTELGKILRLPFLKFICHSASYLVFLLLLLFASLDIADTADKKKNERGPEPTSIELLIVCYILGFIWQEVKQLWDEGILDYTRDWWNLLDYVMNSLYITVIGLRVTAYLNVRFNDDFGGPCFLLNGTDCYVHRIPNKTMQECHLPRNEWDPFDPTLTSEAVFAIANIFSMLRLVYLFIANSHLGPLQISLGRMVEDIVKFCVLIVLVVFSFSAGLNQLYWVYRTEGDNNTCYGLTCDPQNNAFSETEGDTEICYGLTCHCQNNAFSDMFQSLQSLTWSVFGQTSISVVNVEAEHRFTEFVGATMLCVYCIITIIVLLNLLIAMMNTSFQKIQTQADREWKFARSKLWMSYFDEGNTLPPPFNAIPSPKSFYYAIKACCSLCGMCLPSNASDENRQVTLMATITKKKENDLEYQRVMRNLGKRYLNHQRRGEAAEGISEDDLNEIKQDISSFRYELLELLKDKSSKKGKPQDNTEGTRKGSSLSSISMSSFSDSVSSAKSLERVPSYLMRKGRKGKKSLQYQDSSQHKPIKKAPIQDDDMSLPEFLKVRNVKNVVVAVNEMQKQSMRRRLSSTGTELARSFWASHIRQGTITEERDDMDEEEPPSESIKMSNLSETNTYVIEEEEGGDAASSPGYEGSHPKDKAEKRVSGDAKTNEEGKEETNSANSSDNSGETSGIVSNNNSFQSQDSVDEGVEPEADEESLDQDVFPDGSSTQSQTGSVDSDSTVVQIHTPRDWKAKRNSFPWMTLKDSGHEGEPQETVRYVYNGVKDE